MILVTLGTQKQQFTRLLNYIEKSKISEKIIVQSGHTIFKSEKMKIIPFMSYEEMEKLIKKSNLVITHGGTGSILTPLKYGKKVIACARLSKFNEHVDNHQTELVDGFLLKNYILELTEEVDLDDLLLKSKKHKFDIYVSNRVNFINELKKEIEK